MGLWKGKDETVSDPHTPTNSMVCNENLHITMNMVIRVVANQKQITATHSFITSFSAFFTFA